MAQAKQPTKSRAPRATAPKSNAPSAPAYASKYAVGDLISHFMFGDGTVTAFTANKLTIEFPDGVTKQIIDDYVKYRRA